MRNIKHISVDTDEEHQRKKEFLKMRAKRFYDIASSFSRGEISREEAFEILRKGHKEDEEMLAREAEARAQKDE